MKIIFEALSRVLDEGKMAVLAVITEHHGSAPRGAGAMMLVGGDGRLAGTVGGGTIEHETVKMAVRLLAEQRSALQRFSLGGGEGSLDMVCGGGVTVFLQYIAPTEEWTKLAHDVAERLERGTAARLVFRLDGSGVTIEENEEKGMVAADGRFCLPLPIGERAVIFGGGHCAAALAPILHSVGFHVTVFDERPEFVTAERFPTARERITGDYRRIGDYLTLGAEDYVVVMTNGHRHDLEVEAQVLPCMTAYLGVMGSKKKTAAINEELCRRGFAAVDIARLHAPIGLSIRSATPEEIAVSIAGEMILVRAEKREKENGQQEIGCPA